jgi:hypothetical protein
MADDVEFEMTYPCYFLYAEGGGLQCNTVDGHECLCLFTSAPMVQRFHTAMMTQHHGPQHGWREVAVDTVNDYDGLIDRLKSGEADMAASGIRHIVIDPSPGYPVMYTSVRDFIEQLPRS